MKQQTLALIVVFSLTPLGPLAIDIFLPAVLEMQTAFSASDEEIRLLIPIYIFALGGAQLLGGPISDRWGRRVSAFLGLVLYLLGSLLAVFAPAVEWLYVARILQGAGASFAMVTAFAWVRDNFEGKEAGKWLSYMSGLTGSVPMMAPLIGGVLAVNWGWQSTFLIMVVASAVLLVLLPFALPAQRKDQTPAFEADDLPCNLRDMARNYSFVVYALANATSFGALMTYISIAPEIAMTIGGMSKMAFAVTLGVVGLGQVIIGFLAPRIAERIGSHETVVAGLILTIIAGIAVFLTPAIATFKFFAFAGIGGIGFSLLVGISLGLMLQPFPNCSGLASSIAGFIRMFGGATIAALAGQSGLEGTSMLAFALLTSVLPVLLIVANKEKFRDNQPIPL